MLRSPGPGGACGSPRARLTVLARSVLAEARSRSRRPAQIRLYESDNLSLGAVFSREGEEVTVATTTHVPVEVYLRSSYEPDAEYVDGSIEERPAGLFDHASWQGAILIRFW